MGLREPAADESRRHVVPTCVRALRRGKFIQRGSVMEAGLTDSVWLPSELAALKNRRNSIAIWDCK
jgi:hypothetical protein